MEHLTGTPAIAKFFGRGVWDIDRLIYSHGLKLISDPPVTARDGRKFPIKDIYAFGIALELIDLTQEKASSVTATNYLFRERDVENAELVFTHRDLEGPIFLVARLDDWENGTYRLDAIEHTYIKDIGFTGATSLWIINATKLFTDIDNELAAMKDGEA